MRIKSQLCCVLCTTMVPTPPPKQPQICPPQRSISPKGVALHLVLFCSTRFKRLQLQLPKLPLLLRENIVREGEDPLEIVAEAHCLLILFLWDIQEVTVDHQGMYAIFELCIIVNFCLNCMNHFVAVGVLHQDPLKLMTR